LSEPIDQLTYEEGITLEIEAELKALEAHLEGLERAEEITPIDCDLPALLGTNKKRKALLVKRREALAQLKENNPSQKMDSPQKSRRQSSQYSMKKSLPDNAQSVIDATAERLAQKRRQLEENEARFDSWIRDCEAARRRTKAELSGKSRRIEALQQSITEVEKLTMNLREETEAVDQLKRELAVIERKVGQLRRLEQNVERDRLRHKELTATLEKLKFGVREKQAQIEAKDTEIFERRRALEDGVFPLDEQDGKVKQKEAEVAKLEGQIATLAAAVDQAVRAVHQEQNLLAEILPKVTEESDDQFSELREMLKDSE
jgi:predicted RNase H-like nuclease (RuvC/YqgF family)